MAFVKGVIFGLGLMLAMGPVFFTIIQTSIQRGFFTAVLVATGVMLCDTFYVILTVLGLSHFLENDAFKLFLATGGGILMLGYGLVLFFSKVETQHFTQVYAQGSAFKYLAKGWLINFLNPFVFVFWVGVAGLAHVEFSNSQQEQWAFFLGIIVTVYSSDILKSYLANRLRYLAADAFFFKMNKLLGILLVASGLWMLSVVLEVKEVLSTIFA